MIFDVLLLFSVTMAIPPRWETPRSRLLCIHKTWPSKSETGGEKRWWSLILIRGGELAANDSQWWNLPVKNADADPNTLKSTKIVDNTTNGHLLPKVGIIINMITSKLNQGCAPNKQIVFYTRTAAAIPTNNDTKQSKLCECDLFFPSL